MGLMSELPSLTPPSYQDDFNSMMHPGERDTYLDHGEIIRPRPPGLDNPMGIWEPSRGPGYDSDQTGFIPYRPTGSTDDRGNFTPYRPGAYEGTTFVPSTQGYINDPAYGFGYVRADGTFVQLPVGRLAGLVGVGTDYANRLPGNKAEIIRKALDMFMVETVGDQFNSAAARLVYLELERFAMEGKTEVNTQQDREALRRRKLYAYSLQAQIPDEYGGVMTYLNPDNFSPVEIYNIRLQVIGLIKQSYTHGDIVDILEEINQDREREIVDSYPEDHYDDLSGSQFQYLDDLYDRAGEIVKQVPLGALSGFWNAPLQQMVQDEIDRAMVEDHNKGNLQDNKAYIEIGRRAWTLVCEKIGADSPVFKRLRYDTKNHKMLSEPYTY